MQHLRSDALTVAVSQNGVANDDGGVLPFRIHQQRRVTSPEVAFVQAKRALVVHRRLPSQKRNETEREGLMRPNM